MASTARPASLTSRPASPKSSVSGFVSARPASPSTSRTSTWSSEREYTTSNNDDSFNDSFDTSFAEEEAVNLDPIQIMNLLRNFRDENIYVDNDSWTDDIISDLEEIVDLIHFKEYEPILDLGDEASWVGFVLEGSIDVLIEGAKVATLTHGHFVGEMSLFTGKSRNADCIGSKGVKGATIGVIRFDVLDNLWSERPRLVVALMTAMGSAAVHHSAENAARSAANGNNQETESETESVPRGRRSSVTRALKTGRMNAVESAKKEVIYRNKYTDLRRSEKRHQTARKKAETSKKKLLKQRKDLRMSFQKKERAFVDAEAALEKSLQDAVDQRDSLLNESTNKKIDEDAMNRQLRRNLEKTKRQLDKLKVKLNTAHLKSATSEQKYKKLFVKSKQERMAANLANKNLQQNLDVMTNLVQHYESHDHESLVQKVKELSLNNEILKDEKLQLLAVQQKLEDELVLFQKDENTKKEWYKKTIWRLVGERKKRKRKLNVYRDWANEQIVWLEEQLKEKKQECQDVESILKVEVDKSRSKMQQYTQFVTLAKNETKVSIQAKERASRMEHCSFDLYYSSLFQICFIVFVTVSSI